MSLRDELQAVYDQHGRLTPALCVRVAADADHPLHDRFEWDDEIAGHKYRLVQARKLIRSVRVIYKEATEEDEARSVRKWQTIRNEPGTTAYRPVEDIAADPELTAIVLRDMEREWKQMFRRYGHMREFVELVQASLGDADAA